MALKKKNNFTLTKRSVAWEITPPVILCFWWDSFLSGVVKPN